MQAPSLKKTVMSSKILNYFLGRLRGNIFLGFAVKKD
jgi:hypothetical protein